MNASISNYSSLVLSYLALRKAIGILGAALPFVLAIGLYVLFGEGLQSSISAYYHTDMRNVFVGTLCAIGVFLFSYKGYERDHIAAMLASAFAIGTAFFPTKPENNPTHSDKVIGAIHIALAALFFATLAYFSLCLFAKSDPSRRPTPQKLLRNRVYRACGYTIVGALVLIGVYGILPDDVGDQLAQLKPVFWLESVAVVAFGISWLTKGEAILKDED